MPAWFSADPSQASPRNNVTDYLSGISEHPRAIDAQRLFWDGGFFRAAQGMNGTTKKPSSGSRQMAGYAPSEQQSGSTTSSCRGSFWRFCLWLAAGAVQGPNKRPCRHKSDLLRPAASGTVGATGRAYAQYSSHVHCRRYIMGEKWSNWGDPVGYSPGIPPTGVAPAGLHSPATVCAVSPASRSCALPTSSTTPPTNKGGMPLQSRL